MGPVLIAVTAAILLALGLAALALETVEHITKLIGQ